MIPLLLLCALARQDDWYCEKCRKTVPDSDVKKTMCREPHGDIVHKKDCTAWRHLTCRGEVQAMSGRCGKCGKEVAAKDAKVMACADPHPMTHVQNCVKPRHVGCRGEIEPGAGEPAWKGLAAAPLEWDDDAFKGPAFFLSPEKEAKDRAKGGGAIAADAEVYVYALLGWSGNGADPLRAATVDVGIDAKSKSVRVIVTYVAWEKRPDAGTADMKFVGFRSKLGKLAAGEWTLHVFERTASCPAPGKEPTKVSEAASRTKLAFKIGK
jgi:hypothetical protein